MTTGDALLAAIRQHPAEDVPRLEYADWLDEEVGRATERAEFIRVQIELERVNGPKTAEMAREMLSKSGFDVRLSAPGTAYLLAHRERALYDPAHTDWFDLPAVRTGYYARPHIHHGLCCGWAPKTPTEAAIIRGTVARGFPAEIECGSHIWFTFHDTVLATHPVTRVELLTQPDTAGWLHRRVSASPFLVDEYQIAGRWVEWAEGDYLACRGGGVSATEPDWSVMVQHILGKRWPGVTFFLRYGVSSFRPRERTRHAFPRITLNGPAPSEQERVEQIRSALAAGLITPAKAVEQLGLNR